MCIRDRDRTRKLVHTKLSKMNLSSEKWTEIYKNAFSDGSIQKLAKIILSEMNLSFDQWWQIYEKSHYESERLATPIPKMTRTCLDRRIKIYESDSHGSMREMAVEIIAFEMLVKKIATPDQWLKTYAICKYNAERKIPVLAKLPEMSLTPKQHQNIMSQL